MKGEGDTGQKLVKALINESFIYIINLYLPIWTKITPFFTRIMRNQPSVGISTLKGILFSAFSTVIPIISQKWRSYHRLLKPSNQRKSILMPSRKKCLPKDQTHKSKWSTQSQKEKLLKIKLWIWISLFTRKQWYIWDTSNSASFYPRRKPYPWRSSNLQGLLSRIVLKCMESIPVWNKSAWSSTNLVHLWRE